MEAPDVKLLLATHRGHEASARLLWARHGARMLAHACAILGHRAGAEDAVQAVLCRLLDLPRARLAAVEDVPAFLAAATRREALNQLRAAGREARRRSEAWRSADSAAPPTALPDVCSAVDSLPRRLREVVVLKHAGGLTFDQIALALGAHRGTVAGRYRAALEALRRLLEPVHGGAYD